MSVHLIGFRVWDSDHDGFFAEDSGLPRLLQQYLDSNLLFDACLFVGGGPIDLARLWIDRHAEAIGVLEREVVVDGRHVRIANCNAQIARLTNFTLPRLLRENHGRIDGLLHANGECAFDELVLVFVAVQVDANGHSIGVTALLFAGSPANFTRSRSIVMPGSGFGKS